MRRRKSMELVMKFSELKREARKKATNQYLPTVNIEQVRELELKAIALIAEACGFHSFHSCAYENKSFTFKGYFSYTRGELKEEIENAKEHQYYFRFLDSLRKDLDALLDISEAAQVRFSVGIYRYGKAAKSYAKEILLDDKSLWDSQDTEKNILIADIVNGVIATFCEYFASEIKDAERWALSWHGASEYYNNINASFDEEGNRL